MDRASILGDAVEYLKELLQRINDLQNELESTPSSSSLPTTTTTSLHTTIPTFSTLPCHMKDELCPSSLQSPNSQSARVSTNRLFLNSFIYELNRIHMTFPISWDSVDASIYILQHGLAKSNAIWSG